MKQKRSLCFTWGERGIQRSIFFSEQNMVGSKPEALPALPSPTQMDRRTSNPCVSAQSSKHSATTQSSFREVPLHILPYKGLPSAPRGTLERGKEGCQEDNVDLQALLTPFLTIRWTSEHTADLGPKQPQYLPLIRKKKAPVSLATARAISVLPVPGGPYSRIPRGGWGQRQGT